MEARGPALAGITTDGSPMYPLPIADVCGRIGHQICEFHVLSDLTKAVLKRYGAEAITVLPELRELVEYCRNEEFPE